MGSVAAGCLVGTAVEVGKAEDGVAATFSVGTGVEVGKVCSTVSDCCAPQATNNAPAERTATKNDMRILCLITSLS